jgi:hypothetical protein
MCLNLNTQKAGPSSVCQHASSQLLRGIWSEAYVLIGLRFESGSIGTRNMIVSNAARASAIVENSGELVTCKVHRIEHREICALTGKWSSQCGVAKKRDP